MKYKVLSCASFGSSGSGVVTDYLMEFSNIYNPGDYEFRFLQDYGGITTLEDCLVHSHHRLNSDIAIQLFMKYVDYQCGDIFNKRYNRFFKDKFGKISKHFLQKIVEVKWDGYWEEYQILSPPYESIFKYKIFPRILRLLHGNKGYIAKYVPRRNMYFSNPSEEYFVSCVKEYIDELLTVLDAEHQYHYIYLDQLLPPDNINRYFKYFDDLHVIVVDRDPRDYYIENVLKLGEGWVPKDVDKFITLYKGIRKKIDIATDDSRILRIQFEDTIYHYEDFSEKINSFLGLSENYHVKNKEFFNPNKSRLNTQLWNKSSIDYAVIKRIENELSEYCYNF